MGEGWLELMKSRLPPPSTDPPMTEVAALAEARRRWPNGAVTTTPRDGGGHWCHVGFLDFLPEKQFVSRGCGGKWESAFRDAELAEAQHVERRQQRRTATRPGGRRGRQR